MKKVILTIALLLFYCIVFAQQTSDKRIIDFRLSNDFIFGTDHYFSNGIEFSYYGRFMEKSPINRILLPNAKSANVYYSLTFVHNIYTPIELFTSEIQINDQPYAAYLLFGSRKTSYNLQKRIKLISELQLGVLGPLAGGKQVQNTIHSVLPTSRPAEGWGNQISNSPAIQYNASIEKGFVVSNFFELNLIAGGIVGVPYTDLEAGGYIRLGLFNNYFKGIGIGSNKKLQLYVFGSVKYKYILYNALLEGGLFENGTPNNLITTNRLLTNISSGITLAYNSIKLEVTQYMLTPQFVGALKHHWGSARVVICF